MTYAKGSNITALDLNNLTGSVNTTGPYASAAAATGKVAALLGVGYGDRGYGQVSPTLTKKTTGFAHELLWLCLPSGNNGADGGWNTTQFGVDNTKKYRSAVWIKVKNGSGSIYHGLAACFPLGSGTLDTNPYWLANIAANLVPGEWYLSVGVLHESSYAGGSSGLSGLYDINGNKVIGYPEFKQQLGQTVQTHRCYHYYDSDATQRQWFARPRFEPITGSEPSISTMISAPYETVSADTMITPSQWIAGPVTNIGMFAGNYDNTTENEIIKANISSNVNNSSGPTGSVLRAQDLIDLRTAVATICNFQGTPQTLLPPAANFVAGSVMKAEVPATTSYDLPTLISNIDTNRLLSAPGNMSIVNGATSSTRASAWGGGTGGIAFTYTASFASEDAARFFFNSGGAITQVLSHAPTGTTQDANWNTALAALGTISIGARTTTRSGTGGTPAALGFYNMTSSYQIVFDGTIGTAAYATNSIVIEAAAISIAGANGGNGLGLQVRITLIDSHTNAFSDSVAIGTNASIGYKKAASFITGIATPSFAVNINF